MKVFQLVDSFNIGGAEVAAMNIADCLQSQGHDCVICAIGCDGNIRGYLNNKGIKSICLDRPYGFSQGIIIAIGRILLKEQVDVVVTHHFRQLIHSFLPTRVLGKRLVHIEHDFHFYKDKPRLLTRLSFLLRFVDSFVCVSQEIVSWFRANISGIENKSLYINNGVDTNRFKPDVSVRGIMRNNFGITPACFVVGTCARIEPIKNLELLMDGFALFQRQHTNGKLVVVGGGSQLNVLKDRSKHLGIRDRVIFTGVQYEVEKYLAMFDIYTITSRDEGLPLSVLEAMATGLPVISTNVGSLPKLVSNETGVLLSSHCANELKDALLGLAARRDLLARLGNNACSLVHEQYSLTKMAKAYEGVLLPKNCGKKEP